MASNILGKIGPALLSTVLSTPLVSVLDISVINSIYKNDKKNSPMGTIKNSIENFKVDATFGLNFSSILSTLLSTNMIKCYRRQIISGTMFCMLLSTYKDSLLLGGYVGNDTKTLFVIRDGIAISPALMFPGGAIGKQLVSIMGVQIPCTIINSLAVDIHTEKKDDSYGEYINSETFGRIQSSFYNTYVMRVTRGVLSIGTSTGMNHSLKNMLA